MRTLPSGCRDTDETPAISSSVRQQRVRRVLDVDALEAGDQRAEGARRLRREQAPAVDERDAVAHGLGFDHVVRRQQDRPPLALQLADQVPELARRERVHAGRRLVEEEHARVAHQAAREVQSLLHARASTPRPAGRRAR